VSLDVRAWIYCNLGQVISGNLQESSIIGAGLINVTGSLVLSGVYKIREGDPVELSYYKNNRVARLGRKMRVLSAYANPATRQTEVSIGCYLTYQAQSAPPPQVLNSANDTNTPDLTGLAALLLIKPTSAKFVAETCCAALGLRHDPFPLTNQFYREKFEISGPYLNIVSDLLISENYVGYVDSTETLRFINLNDVGGRGPVLNETNIIDVSPINSGEPDADVVYSIVQRKEIKLDYSIDANSVGSGGSGPADTEEIEKVLERNDIPVTPETIAVATGDPEDPKVLRGTAPSGYWLKGYNTELAEIAVFRYQPPRQPGATEQPAAVEVTVTYNPSSKWEASYDGFNRITSRSETKGGVWGDTRTTVSYSYSSGNGTETVTQRKTETTPGAEIVLACGFPPEVIPPLPANIRAASGQPIIKERATTITRSTSRSVITTEYRTVPMVYTAAGAANIQKYLESYTKRFRGEDLKNAVKVGDVLSYARSYVSLPATIRFATKAPEVNISQSFSTTDTTTTTTQPDGKYPYSVDSLTEEQKTSLLSQELDAAQSGTASTSLPGGSTTGTLDEASDSKAGYTAEVLEIPEILYTKNTSGGIMLEFTPPYLSDDRLSKSGDKYLVTPSDAAVKAKAFADRQNKLRFGKRNGQSIVFPVEYVPTRPYSPIYLEFLGVVGQYRTDSTNIVFDSTGILVSTDAIFLGGVGQ
jgi:hypothetical protein